MAFAPKAIRRPVNPGKNRFGRPSVTAGLGYGMELGFCSLNVTRQGGDVSSYPVQAEVIAAVRPDSCYSWESPGS